MVSAQEVSDDLCIEGLPNGTLIYQWGSLIPHLQNLQWKKGTKVAASCVYSWLEKCMDGVLKSGTPSIIKDSALANLNI